MTLIVFVHRSLAQKLANSAAYNISSIINNLYNHKTETSAKKLLLSEDFLSFIFRPQFEFTFTISTRKTNCLNVARAFT